MGFAFLAVAAAMDWRSRRVKDEVWIVLGAVGLGLLELELILHEAAPAAHIVSVATAILYFGVFFGEPMWDDDGFHFRPIRLFLYAAVPVLLVFALWGAGAGTVVYRLLTMPVMIAVAHAMYYVNLLRGGADAKAVMALALLFPGAYPHVGPFPILTPSALVEPILAVWFPFAFVVLASSALLLLVLPLALLARNAAEGHAPLPRALFGYRVSIDRVPEFAWLMDRVENGERVTVYFPRQADDREEQLALLRERGVERVWVTPQLPFITAILAGYAIAVFLGNPLLAPFGGLR